MITATEVKQVILPQYNHISGQNYGGHNQIDLQIAKQKNNFQSDGWLTFLQARISGLTIKKGSHGIKILSPFISGEKTIKLADGKTKTEAVKFIPRSYTVFNLDQTQPL